MRNVVVLGSTGSIGVSTLEVIAAFPDQLRVVGLGSRRNIGLLKAQIERFRPRLVAVSDESRAAELQKVVDGVEVLSSQEGIVELAGMEEADIVVTAMVGAVGLSPTLAAIGAGKRIALANKEVLVCAGEIVMREASGRGAEIIPIDSEHSALHQCLRSGKGGEVKKLILTASGGPFLDWSSDEMEKATPDEALRHPRWEMGRKITVDSATMMNKALEMVEARWLFEIEPTRIDVLIHEESIVHSMVEFQDGSMIAQMSLTDMRVPIQYALLYPERVKCPWGSIELGDIGALHFRRPDPVRFPALDLARWALGAGGTLPAVMNAANEVAVERFLANGIAFTGITSLIREVMQRHRMVEHPSLEDIKAADAWARDEAGNYG